MNNNHTEQNIYVYMDDQDSSSAPILIGTLHTILVRGKITFSFEYESNWLSQTSSTTLDPSLQLFQGRQYAPIHQDNFGIFLDSSPDRWGRLLMNRRETVLAREENRKPRTLLEPDYLLGVYDQHRIGALRFKTAMEGSFLDNNTTLASPPWTSLRELEQACLFIETPNAEKDPHYARWLNMLIAPGGSLGGARPKASIIDSKKHLWIAKFPSRNDWYDIGAWEMLVNQLANRSGIITAKAQIKQLASPHHTFLSQRFDRTDKNTRIHFASAMTLLQHTDGDDTSSGVSYLELVEFLMQHGNQPIQDLEQLWRRIVFSICVSNTDDHLRNHGFLFYPGKGWFLSPAYDINPNPTGNGLRLNISETDNSQDLELAKEVAQFFRLSSNQANQIISDIVKEVSQWRRFAMKMNISSHEQGLMENAFRVVNT